MNTYRKYIYNQMCAISSYPLDLLVMYAASQKNELGGREAQDRDEFYFPLFCYYFDWI